MLQPALLYCINSDCRQPRQNAGNKFCQACGTPILLRNRYAVLQKLGSGGFAMTYSVWDLQTRTERVLKVLTETASKAIELFEQEARILAQLNHPGIPSVEADSYFQVATPQRRLPCLVMEKIHGQTLQDLIEQYPQGCPPDWVIDWLGQAIDILQLLHQQHIIHRDIKPSNLMLRQGSGQLVMIDFGGVKQLRTVAPLSSTRLFSPGYSPPEQAAGESVNGTADFFALGRTLIHLLTGQNPAGIENPATGELNWRQYAQVSPRLAALLDDMTQLNPRRRPIDAHEIRSRLLPIVRSYTTRSIATIPLLRRPHLKFSVWKLIVGLLRSILWAVWAVFASAWSIVMAVGGAIVGTAVGSAIALFTTWGTDFASWLSQQLSQLLPAFNLAIGTDLLIFALAGWGTAWGLTAAGGLGQRRRIWSGAIGSLAYLLGWIGLHEVHSEGATVGIALFAAIAPPLVVLGLGIASDVWFRVIVAIVTLPLCLLMLAEFLPRIVQQLGAIASSPLGATPNAQAFWASLLFFGLLAGLLAASLSVSHYLLVPIWRWLTRPTHRARPATHR